MAHTGKSPQACKAAGCPACAAHSRALTLRLATAAALAKAAAR